MTFPPTPAGGRAAECKPSPRKAAATPPAELPAQPPKPPKYRQFIKLAICLKPQVCKAPEIAPKGTAAAAIDPPRTAPKSGAEIIAEAAQPDGDRSRRAAARRHRARAREQEPRQT